MAEFVTYRPTEGLTADERKTSAYYSRIYEWMCTNESIQRYFNVTGMETVSEATNTVTLTPKAENLAGFTIKFIVELRTTQVNFLYCKISYGSSSATSTSVGSDYFADDIPFIIYDDESNFVLKFNGNVLFGTFAGKTFGGQMQNPILLHKELNSSKWYMYVCHTGLSYTKKITESYNRICGGVSGTYLVSQAQMPGVDMLADKLYILDGGGDLPPDGEFLINGKRYCTFFGNLILKME